MVDDDEDDDDEDEPDFYSRVEPRHSSNNHTTSKKFYATLDMPPPPLIRAARAAPNFSRRPPDLMPITRPTTSFSSLANKRSSYGLLSSEAADKPIGLRMQSLNAQWGQRSDDVGSSSSFRKFNNCPPDLMRSSNYSNKFQTKVEKVRFLILLWLFTKIYTYMKNKINLCKYLLISILV